MRNRIVINLDAREEQATQRSRAAGGKRRRWPRVLAILAGLAIVGVVLVLIGAFIWWRYYQSTPSYTLTMMVYAAERNDLAELQKQIDDEAIAKNMVASISQKAASRYGLSLSGSIQQEIEKMMPSLLPQIKQTVHDEFVKEIRAYSARTSSEPRPFIVLVVTLPSLMTVTTQGDVAQATTAFGDRKIELTMKRDADRWKVTEYKDDVVVQRVVDSVIKELPAIGSFDTNTPLLKKLARTKPRRRGR